MEKIKIQKEKAIKIEKIKRVFFLFVGTIFYFLVMNSVYNLFLSDSYLLFEAEYNFVPVFLFYSFIFMSIWELVFYNLFILKINSLEYYIDIENSKLISSWKAILKTKDTARLQVVNSVDIGQSIWGKFVDLYYVTVSYGFSGGGYDFSFEYLSENEAESILNKIKPVGGRIGVDIE